MFEASCMIDVYNKQMDQGCAVATVPASDAVSAGHAHLRLLIRTVRDIVAIRASRAYRSVPPGEFDTRSSTQLGVLQQQYDMSKAALTSCFRQIAGSTPSEDDTAMQVERGMLICHVVSSTPRISPILGVTHACAEALQQRYDTLIHDIEQRNETIKELMDMSRHLMEAMCMWEAHKKTLELNQHAAQR